jgi:energy-coupling factor transporter ATP-binding protein EcfA2
VLLISEDLDEVFALADRIAVMHHGRLSEAARPAASGRWRRSAWRWPVPPTRLRQDRMRLERASQVARCCWCSRRCWPSRHAGRQLAAGGLGRRAGGPAYALLLQGGFGSRFALTETLTRATPLIFTGLAAAVAFRARLYNIGAEGQLYLGALAAVAVGGLHGGSGFEAPPWAAVAA